MNDIVFTSDRERRLWQWTLAAIVAVFLTLAFAGSLEAYLRDRHMLDNTFFALFLVVIAAIFGSGLKGRTSNREIWVGIGIAAVYGTVLLRSFVPTAARSHLFEFGLVAVLIYSALSERRRNGRHVPLPAILAIAATTAIGAVDECLQLLLPGRVFDPLDMLFNLVAAVMAVTASAALGWARGRFSHG